MEQIRENLTNRWCGVVAAPSSTEGLAPQPSGREVPDFRRGGPYSRNLADEVRDADFLNGRHGGATEAALSKSSREWNARYTDANTRSLPTRCALVMGRSGDFVTPRSKIL